MGVASMVGSTGADGVPDSPVRVESWKRDYELFFKMLVEAFHFSLAALD
jgi:hypothetical protein